MLRSLLDWLSGLDPVGLWTALGACAMAWLAWFSHGLPPGPDDDLKFPP